MGTRREAKALRRFKNPHVSRAKHGAPTDQGRECVRMSARRRRRVATARRTEARDPEKIPILCGAAKDRAPRKAKPRIRKVTRQACATRPPMTRCENTAQEKCALTTPSFLSRGTRKCKGAAIRVSQQIESQEETSFSRKRKRERNADKMEYSSGVATMN